MAGLGIRRRCKVCGDCHVEFRCCVRCKRMLPLSCFYKRKSGIHKGYYLSNCKECSVVLTVFWQDPVKKQILKKERERIKNRLYLKYVREGRISESEFLNEELI